MKKCYILTYICILFIIFQVRLFAEPIILEEIIVKGERDVLQKECLDIRDLKETPARDVGEAIVEFLFILT